MNPDDGKGPEPGVNPPHVNPTPPETREAVPEALFRAMARVRARLALERAGNSSN